MPNWRFRGLKKSELNRGTTEEEFFRGGESSIDSLVRESIQNSLDAEDRALPGPVRVRFFVSGAGGAVPRKESDRWLNELVPHLVASKIIESEGDVLTTTPFVVIEDFKTLGLSGSVTAARQTEFTDAEREFFYFFWRNIGITGKGRDNRGSWGLGKLVFPAASAHRAMFGLTVRRSDAKQYLMGMAGLGQHTMHGGQWHDAFGFFGEFGKDQDDPDFVLPVDDAAILGEFRKAFRLSRQMEPGVSFVVPYPRDEELLASGAPDAFARAVLHQFAYPIAAGKLTVDVESPSRTIHINRGNLEVVASELDWAMRLQEKTKVREAIALAKWALENSESPFPFARRTDALTANWEELRIEPEALQLARERFTQGNPVAFEVPVLVRRKGGQKELSRFRVFVRQRNDVVGTHCSFVRQGLTVTDIPGPTASGLIALTVVEDPPLAELLRAAENPAHTKWSGKADRLNSNFTGGSYRVDVVTSAPREVLRHLLNSDAHVDRELLADIFPEPSAEGTRKRMGETRGKKKRTGPMPTPPPPVPRPLRIDKASGGFVATHVAAVPRMSDRLQIDVAYDCIGGSPWTAYEHFDFDFSGNRISFACENAQIVTRSENRLCLQVDDGFRIKVSGFEQTRDLIVKYRWLGDPLSTSTIEGEVPAGEEA